MENNDPFYIHTKFLCFLSPTQKPEHGISDNWKELMRKYDYVVCKRSVLGDLVTLCDVLETERKLIGAARHWFANLTLKDRLNHLRGVKKNIPIRDALAQGLTELYRHSGMLPPSRTPVWTTDTAIKRENCNKTKTTPEIKRRKCTESAVKKLVNTYKARCV